jgi:hypothetical protein
VVGAGAVVAGAAFDVGGVVVVGAGVVPCGRDATWTAPGYVVVPPGRYGCDVELVAATTGAVLPAGVTPPDVVLVVPTAGAGGMYGATEAIAPA